MNAAFDAYLTDPGTSAHPIADGYSFDLAAAFARHGWASQVVANPESSPGLKRGVTRHADPAGAGTKGLSMRSIVEISNDSAAAISDGRANLADLLARALTTGSDAAWDKLRPYGINRIVERHPTEPAKVVVGKREIQVR